MASPMVGPLDLGYGQTKNLTIRANSGGRWMVVHLRRPRSSYECNDPNEEEPCGTWTSRNR
jgi:hypothetical protein